MMDLKWIAVSMLQFAVVVVEFFLLSFMLKNNYNKNELELELESQK